jgi:hypothetical protein
VTEDGVATTSEGKRLSSHDRDDLLPSLRFDIEDIDIIEGDSSVVETTVSTIDVDLTLVVASSGVGSWGRSTDEGLLVFFSLLVTSDTGPGAFFGVKEPGIVQANGWTGVSSKDEHAVGSRDRNCNVLSTGERDLITLRLELLPDPVLTGHSELIHVGDGFHFLTLTGLGDSSVHEVAALAHEVHRVTRARTGLFSRLFLFLPL